MKTGNWNWRDREMQIWARSEAARAAKRFTRWFGNQPIKRKILLLYVPLIVVPLLVLGIVSNMIFVNVTVDKMAKAVADDSALISVRIDSMLADMKNCANITTLNLIQFYHENTRDSSNAVDALVLQRKIENILRTGNISFPNVDSMLFIDANQRAVTLNTKLLSNLDEGLQSEIYNRVMNSSPSSVWFSMEYRDFFVTDKDTPILSLGKRVIDTETGDTLGVLILNLNETSVAAVFPQFSRKGGSVFLVDDDDIVIASQDKEKLLKPLEHASFDALSREREDFNEILRLDGQKTLVAGRKLQNFDWRLMIIIPVAELTAGVNSSATVMLVLIFVFMILVLTAANILSALTAKPIVSLTEKMREIQGGDFAVSIQAATTDEVGELAAGFNKMMKRINDLTAQSVMKQKKLREYELALIQAQIKPHFLYNSLGLVYTLCGMAGATEAQTATKSLADFYRAALSAGKEIISVEEEIKNVKDYLYIQSKRFSDFFEYQITVDEQILHKKILKLSLQPIVENAIHHGLVPKGSFGHLQITGQQEGSQIVFTVADDGVGMDAQIASHLLDRENEDARSGSFGMRSVHERFQLFYGEQYGLEVQSSKGHGTQVRLVMPVNGGSIC